MEKIEQMPLEFWEDKDWAFDNYERWMAEYPNQWIAVVGKEVVAAGKDVQEIKTIAREKTGRKYIPVIYVEGDIHVY